MKNFTFILSVLAVFILSGCEFFIPKTWKYKVTVEVETPSGLKTGSAIRHIKARRELAGFLGQGVVHYQTYGEAVVVDLDQYGTLFVLIDEFDYQLLFEAFNINFADPSASISYFADLPVGTRGETTKFLVPFVTFENLSDLTTVKGAAPPVMKKVFGEGVKFKKITIEITDLPITEGIIEEYLPNFYESKLGKRISIEETKKLLAAGERPPVRYYKNQFISKKR